MGGVGGVGGVGGPVEGGRAAPCDWPAGVTTGASTGESPSWSRRLEAALEDTGKILQLQGGINAP